MSVVKIDKMALADCFDPRGIVEEIFRQNPKIELPIPVEEIAKSCGVRFVFENPELPDSIVGMLVTTTDPYSYEYRSAISYNSGLIEERKRFTIGHELGHFLLPSHENTTQCSASDVFLKTSEKEKEANKFSSLLLIPDSTITPILSASQITMNDIVKLFEACNSGVSIESFCIRILDMLRSVDVHAALIVSNTIDGMKYSYCTSKVIYSALKFRKGAVVPIPVVHSKGITCRSKVASERWFSSTVYNCDSIFEQTYVYPDTRYRITLLTLVH